MSRKKWQVSFQKTYTLIDTFVKRLTLNELAFTTKISALGFIVFAKVCTFNICIEGKVHTALVCAKISETLSLLRPPWFYLGYIGPYLHLETNLTKSKQN